MPHLIFRVLGIEASETDVAGTWPFEVGCREKWSKTSLPMTSQQRTFAQIKSEGPSGHALRMKQVLMLAQVRDCQACVVLVDCEKWEARQCLRDTLVRASSEFATQNSGTEITCVIGTPCRSTETWLLADVEAVKQELDGSFADVFPQEPEKRPSPRELKARIVQLASAVSKSVTETQIKLARRASPQILECRCPCSYPPFAKDVRDFLKPMLGTN